MIDFRYLTIVFLLYGLFFCPGMHHASAQRVRLPVDSIGFATTSRQMDSIMARMEREQGEKVHNALKAAAIDKDVCWKTVISPHDDYTYVGYLYPAIMKNLKAKTIILVGVAHKARQLGLENQLIFDSFSFWKAPYGHVPVSSLRQEIKAELPAGMVQVNDSMQRLEHSLEALVPFIQYYHPGAEIIPILVPFMDYERTNEIARNLAGAIEKTTRKKNLVWGRDFAIVISSDAVHYGDRDWGESNYAFFGADTAGYKAAVAHEQEIIRTLSGHCKPEQVRKFISFTVDEKDYKKYKWTWCGRYSIPMGLLTSWYLTGMLGEEILTGIPAGYATSIDHEKVRVSDLGMGVTAPANIRHWVGYAAIGYK